DESRCSSVHTTISAASASLVRQRCAGFALDDSTTGGRSYESCHDAPRTSWIGSKLATRAASDSCLLKLLGDLPTGRDCLSLSGDKGSCQELQLSGERLHFRKIEGDGPDAGWVSTRPEWVCLNAAPACFTFPGNGG
ncbi:unnamed protein product, partial [Symbiodinium necroappetens]